MKNLICNFFCNYKQSASRSPSLVKSPQSQNNGGLSNIFLHEGKTNIKTNSLSSCPDLKVNVKFTTKMIFNVINHQPHFIT